MLNDFFVFKKIKEGDIKAFENIFRHYYSPLYLYAFSITGRKEIAEEIVQELFYIIWKERESIHISGSVKSYLYKATKNQSLKYLEHVTVEERYSENIRNKKGISSEPIAQEQLEYQELEEIINRTFRKLPERRLQIFRMHRMEGKKYKEIAEGLSLSVKTVEAEMTKVYKALKNEIEKYTQANYDS